MSDRIRANKINWDNSKPYGILIKKYLKEFDKYITVIFTEKGTLEYKSQWKEHDRMTIKD